ncbi:MAG: hypothetical protein V3W34_10035 [Phycisphaerae bacterium]
MTKRELIDRISSVNRSATRDFLAEFSERDLADYMRQLTGLGLLPTEHDSSPADVDVRPGNIHTN